MATAIHPVRSSRAASITRALARASAPLTRPLAGHRLIPLWGVVHHRGRRTGRGYATPVAVRVSDVAFVIALPWGDQTQWVRNVVAAGGCEARWRDASHLLTDPELVGIDAAAPVFSPLQRSILRAAGVTRFIRLRRAVAAPG